MLAIMITVNQGANNREEESGMTNITSFRRTECMMGNMMSMMMRSSMGFIKMRSITDFSDCFHKR